MLKWVYCQHQTNLHSGAVQMHYKLPQCYLVVGIILTQEVNSVVGACHL
jgi:hypothetical protein